MAVQVLYGLERVHRDCIKFRYSPQALQNEGLGFRDLGFLPAAINFQLWPLVCFAPGAVIWGGLAVARKPTSFQTEGRTCVGQCWPFSLCEASSLRHAED